jgi:NitT/TauT family transport system substrate-binding protein
VAHIGGDRVIGAIRSALTALVLLATLGTVERGTAQADPALMQISIATIPADIGAEVYYAKDRKFFEKNGLDVTITPFQSGAAMAASVIGGSSDIGWSNTMSLAGAYLRGISFTILAPANMHEASAPTSGILIVPRASPIHTAKDLAGKTIAAGAINSIADTATKAWIDANGGDATKSRFVEMPMSTMVTALQTGHIDVANIAQSDYVTDGKPDDPYRRIGSSYDAIAPRFAASVWFTSTAWANKHPDAVKAFAATMRQTAAWANTHHRESALILAKYTQQAPADIMGVRRVRYGERLTDDLVQPEIDVAARYGLIKASVPAASLINALAR